VLLLILLSSTGIFITEMGFELHQIPANFSGTVMIFLFLIPLIFLMYGAIIFCKIKIKHYKEQVTSAQLKMNTCLQ
jgi:hypothetical protein